MKTIGRVGALAVALGIGMAIPVPAQAAACPGGGSECLYVPPPKTALVLGGTTIPTPDQFYLDAVRDNFVGPLNPGDTITYVPVTTPMELWPFTGAGRVVWFFLGPPEIFGPGGSAWPDESVLKLSGLFDLTFDQSVAQGVTNLDQEISDRPGEHLVVFGYSQGAIVANLEKQALQDQYPNGDGPDIEFMLIGDPNVPNGGLAARFPGLYLPILDFTFNGPAPTDTQFHTTDVIQQYDGVSDFPLYPINLASTGNALLGAVFIHPRDLEVNPEGVIHTVTGDTDYYFLPTENLPLFEPLRLVGVPEPVIDVVEPVVKEVVEMGYDRTIPPGTPTPARLIPPLPTAQNVHDVVNALDEGVDNAKKLTPASMTDGFKFSPTIHDSDAATGDNTTTRPRPLVNAVNRITDTVDKVVKRVTDRLTPKEDTE